MSRNPIMQVIIEQISVLILDIPEGETVENITLETAIALLVDKAATKK